MLVTGTLTTIILPIILELVGAQALSNLVGYLGSKAGQQLRNYATELARIITKNNQLLSDFKTANETKKAGIIQSLISSSGLGPRIESLRSAYNKAVDADKKRTSMVEEANAGATKAMNQAEIDANNASTGLIGAAEAIINGPGNRDNPDQYDLTQNTNGGLQSK